MDRYGNHYHQGSGLWRSFRDRDFEESEVWDVLRESNDQGLETFPVTSLPGDRTNRCASMHLPSAPVMVPQSGNTGGVSRNSSTPRSIFAHQSAPVNIPSLLSNVKKHLGRSESSKAPKSRPWRSGNNDDDDDGGEDDEDDDDDDDDDDRYGERLPPHEYIAMRLERSKISSFSVFEGVGRKLKGRDLSKVRNDVLTKTGFLESP